MVLLNIQLYLLIMINKELEMNKFYKLLIYFRREERIARSFLLRKPNITEELIEEAINEDYIREIHNDNDEIQYVITVEGIRKRDD